MVQCGYGPGKFEIAKELGCTDVLNPKDYEKPIQQVIRNALRCEGTHEPRKVIQYRSHREVYKIAEVLQNFLHLSDHMIHFRLPRGRLHYAAEVVQCDPNCVFALVSE